MWPGSLWICGGSGSGPDRRRDDKSDSRSAGEAARRVQADERGVRVEEGGPVDSGVEVEVTHRGPRLSWWMGWWGVEGVVKA